MQNSAFCVVNEHLSSQEFGVETKISEIQGRVVKDDSGSCAVFTEQGSSASQMTAAKVMGCHGKATRMRRTSSGRKISLHPGQNGRCSIVFFLKFKVRMSRYLDTSTKHTNGQNHGPVWKIQSFLSSEICMVILWQDCYGKDNSRKFY